MVLDLTVRYTNDFSNNTHDGTKLGLRVSSHVITACRWTEGPFLADGTAMRYVTASPRYTIRFPSLRRPWPMKKLTVTERFSFSFLFTDRVIIIVCPSVPFPWADNTLLQKVAVHL
jgi:hypothetical protein